MDSTAVPPALATYNYRRRHVKPECKSLLTTLTNRPLWSTSCWRVPEVSAVQWPDLVSCSAIYSAWSHGVFQQFELQGAAQTTFGRSRQPAASINRASEHKTGNPSRGPLHHSCHIFFHLPRLGQCVPSFALHHSC